VTTVLGILAEVWTYGGELLIRDGKPGSAVRRAELMAKWRKLLRQNPLDVLRRLTPRRPRREPLVERYAERTVNRARPFAAGLRPHGEAGGDGASACAAYVDAGLDMMNDPRRLARSGRFSARIPNLSASCVDSGLGQTTM
jgi:hypothetical protein